MCDAEISVPEVSVAQVVGTDPVVHRPVSAARDEGRVQPREPIRFTLKGLMLFTTLVAIAFAVVRKDLIFGLILGATTIPAIMTTWQAAKRRKEAGESMRGRELFVKICESILVNTFVGAAACVAFVMGEVVGWLVMLVSGDQGATTVVSYLVGFLFAGAVIFLAYRYRTEGSVFGRFSL